MPHATHTRFAGNGPLTTRTVFTSGCLLFLLISDAWSQEDTPLAGKFEKPVATVVLGNIDEFYKDLKFVFDLVGDEKGYKTLKETTDQFLAGVETDKPCAINIYATADGTRAVGTLPIKNDADYKKFLENLFDIDVKTAPPPKRAAIPPEVQKKLRSLKLQSNERLVFGLYDAFLKYEAGYVEIGESLDDVRIAKGGASADLPKGVNLALRVDGKAQTSAVRRKAFHKSTEDVLKNLKKWDKESDTAFGLRKAILEHDLSSIGDLFADSSRIDSTWTTSYDKKQARLHAQVTAGNDSPLGKMIEQIGHEPDSFAGVSKEDCVVSWGFNLPGDRRREESMKSVTKHARAALRARSADKAGPKAHQRIDPELTDLACDVVDNALGMAQFNGFLRTWSGHHTLTSVGAMKVPDTARIIELLQKLKAKAHEGQTVELKVDREEDVDIHKVTVGEWQKDAPELFDDEGAVYIGTGEKVAWYALGPKALERLKGAIQQAKQGGPKDGPASDFQASLLPLVEVWDAIRSHDGGKTADSKATATEKKSGDSKRKGAKALSAVHDLQLHKLALEAFHKGNDTISLTLSRKGDGLELAGQFDEGTLRFVGLALSKFVKENLED